MDTQVPWHPGWKDLARNKNLDLTVLSEEYGPFDHFSLLPHPDLANIRIRRLQDGGAEKVIDVNLAKIIAASTDQTTPEEVRKADVMLQLGDVVEISLLKERLGEPWKGFTAHEETFFAKALGGRVRITDEQGNITVRDLLYKAPTFHRIGYGLDSNASGVRHSESAGIVADWGCVDGNQTRRNANRATATLRSFPPGWR